MQPFEKGDVFVGVTLLNNPDDDHAGDGSHAVAQGQQSPDGRRQFQTAVKNDDRRQHDRRVERDAPGEAALALARPQQPSARERVEQRQIEQQGQRRQRRGLRGLEPSQQQCTGPERDVDALAK